MPDDEKISDRPRSGIGRTGQIGLDFCGPTRYSAFLKSGDRPENRGKTMKNQMFVMAGVIGLLGLAWHFGQPKKLVLPMPKSETVTPEVALHQQGTETPPQKLVEGLDLSRAFNPSSDEDVSPLVLASFVAPDTKPAPPSIARYRSMLLEVDTLNPTGLRLGWLSLPLPPTDVLDIMPRQIEK
jgi:hypothetical protein